MSKRYIDADALTAEFKRLTLGENSFIERVFADGVYAVIETFPTADVVEVRRAYNKLFDYPSLFECSECGAYDDDTYTGEGEYKYCPWCGAKMDGDRSTKDAT